MSEKESRLQEDDEGIVIIMEDEDGNQYLYEQELILPVGDDRYALLVSVSEEDDEEAHEHDCDCGCEDEAFFAKIVVNAEGEEEYVEPTDEEFEMVQKAYEALIEEEESAGE